MVMSEMGRESERMEGKIEGRKGVGNREGQRKKENVEETTLKEGSDGGKRGVPVAGAAALAGSRSFQ